MGNQLQSLNAGQDLPVPMHSIGLTINPANKNQILLIGAISNPNIYTYDIASKQFHLLKDSNNYHQIFNDLYQDGETFSLHHCIVPFTIGKNDHFILSIGSVPNHLAILNATNIDKHVNATTNSNTTTDSNYSQEQSKILWKEKSIIKNQFPYKKYCTAVVHKQFLFIYGPQIYGHPRRYHNVFSIYQLYQLKKKDSFTLYEKPKLLKRKMVDLITRDIKTSCYSGNAMIILTYQCIEKNKLLKQYLVDCNIMQHVSINENMIICVIFGGVKNCDKRFRSSFRFIIIDVNSNSINTSTNTVAISNDVGSKIATNINNHDDERKESGIEDVCMNIVEETEDIKKSFELLRNMIVKAIDLEARKSEPKDLPSNAKFGKFSYHLIKQRYVLIIGGCLEATVVKTKDTFASNYIWYFDLNTMKLHKSNVFLPLKVWNHRSVLDTNNDCLHIMGGTSKDTSLGFYSSLKQELTNHWIIDIDDIINDYPFIVWKQARIIWIGYYKTEINLPQAIIQKIIALLT